MNKRKAAVQTNEKREKGKKLDKKRNRIICESDSRPMRRLHQHFRAKKPLKKEAKAKVFESILTDFQKELEDKNFFL